MSVHLVGVSHRRDLTGVHLIGVYLTGMYVMGMHLIGHASHRRVHHEGVDSTPKTRGGRRTLKAEASAYRSV